MMPDKEALRQKLKNFWDSPYAAPITQPLKNIRRFTLAPVGNFFECLKSVLRDNDEESFVARLVAECQDAGTTNAKPYTAAIMWIGMVGGGAGAAFGGWMGIAALGLGHICAGISAVALTGVGVVAGPFVLAGAAALTGFVIGCGAAVPSSVDGVRKVFQHIRGERQQASAVQAVPGLQEAAPDMRKKAGDILEQVAEMPENCRGPFLKALNERYAATGGDDAARILKSIEALPDDKREEIAVKLREMLTGAFEAVAKKEMGETVVLKKAAMQGGPLKLKSQNQGSAAA